MKRIRETCLECGGPIPADNRIDSKFCDSSCKARYWRKKKERGSFNGIGNKQKQDNPVPKTSAPFEGLSGVDNNTPKEGEKDTSQKLYYSVQDWTSEGEQVDTKEYREAMAEKARIEVWGKRILSDLARCENNIQKELENIKRFSNVRTSRGKYNWTKKQSIDRDDLFWEEDMLEAIQKDTPDNQRPIEACKQNIQSIEARKKTLLKELDDANKAMNIIMNRLKTIPRYEEEQKPMFKLAALLKAIETKKIKEQQQGTQSESTPHEMKENENNMDKINNTAESIPPNDRIISSRELMKLDYKSRDFLGRWKEFLGQPSINFHFAVHGLPGGGKSTFCLQLADYLAKNFGNVIYVSGEEGYSKTLKDKVILTKADSRNLYFHDAKNLDDITLHIPVDRFHFIFIDSLDTLRIDAMKLKELKGHYPKSAFVTISQSRKDGKMKGDNEILHDADTVIGIYNGIATTSKNRFNPSGRQFEVFSKNNNGNNK